MPRSYIVPENMEEAISRKYPPECSRDFRGRGPSVERARQCADRRLRSDRRKTLQETSQAKESAATGCGHMVPTLVKPFIDRRTIPLLVHESITHSSPWILNRSVISDANAPSHEAAANHAAGRWRSFRSTFHWVDLNRYINCQICMYFGRRDIFGGMPCAAWICQFSCREVRKGAEHEAVCGLHSPSPLASSSQR